MDIQTLNAACRYSFDAFAARAFREVEPGTDYEWNWHVGCISEHLEAVYRGEIRRLIINLPPRHLKSYLVSSAFPAWVLGHDPSARFIMASYAHHLAEQMVSKSRRIIESPFYRQLFPNFQFSRDTNKKHHFETDKNGMYYSNALQSITGTGGDYVLVDDPINPKEAASDTLRANAIEDIRSTLFSRFNDPRKSKFIMIMQRLHENDPTGNLLLDGGYVHLKLPSIADKPRMIMLGKKTWTMKKGDLLFPERFNKDALEALRTEMGSYNFAGQYLQEPVPIGGGEFKSQWINYYSAGGIRPKTMNIYILCDAAGGDGSVKAKRKLSDFTAFMVVGVAPDNNYYLLDIVRDRMNPTERIDKLFELHRKWNDLGGKAPKVGYEKYGMMTDNHYIKVKQDDTSYRFPVIQLAGPMAKEDRIRRMIPDMENGRWWFPANLMYTDTDGRTMNLVSELVNSEMPTFPRARFDDMLDALSRIYDSEMNVVFPKVKQGHAQRIIEKSMPKKTRDWMNA